MTKSKTLCNHSQIVREATYLYFLIVIPSVIMGKVWIKEIKEAPTSMIIVYLSLALFIGSVAYLGFSAFKTFKDAKPAMNTLNELAGRLQVKADTLKTETEKLKNSQEELMNDIEGKKKAVQSAVFAVKQTPVMLQQLLKIKPVAQLEMKRKARLWNMRHNRA
jgi:uncharacterized protein YoxC